MRLLELFEQITPGREWQMKKQFTCGSCMYLALVLNQKFNWPLVGILAHEEAEEEPDGIVHIWVEPPGTQKAVDIYGIHDIDQLAHEWEEAGEDVGGEYAYDISPKWVKQYIQSDVKFKQKTLKQAYRAMQDYLLPQMREQGIIESKINEGQAIREYDPGVVKWIRKARKRPDADELYLHGTEQERDIFDPKTKRHSFSLLHFSKLTDPRFHRRASQAEYYGPRLFLAKLKYKKPFDVRYPDSEAAQMYDKLVPKHYYQHRLSYEDLHLVVPAALKRGYDMFVVFEHAVTTESYAVPDHNQVEVIDIYDATKAKEVSDAEYMKRYRAWKAHQDQAEQYHGPLERINESMADQLIDSKVSRKFTFIAMAIKLHKDESSMVDVIERAADEFVDSVEAGNYATLEDAEHDRDIILDMIRLLSDKLYLHDEIKKSSKTAQLLAGRIDLARIGPKWPDLRPESGSETGGMPTLS